MRFLTISISAMFILLLAPSAGARDFAKSVETGKRLTCATASGVNKSKCERDQIKQWDREMQFFREKQNDKVEQWHLDNDTRGLTPEYQADLSAFNKSIQQEQKAFNEAMKVARKKFFDDLKALRGTIDQTGTTPRKGRQVTPADEATAKEKCKRHKSKEALRVCVRQQLKLATPGVTIRGAVTNRQRGQ